MFYVPVCVYDVDSLEFFHCSGPFIHYIWRVYQPEKVDTEKIFQLNNFSKVVNCDIFARLIVQK